MKFILSLPAGLAASLLLAFAPKTQAHSWVELLNVVAPNGTFVGNPGYVRGNVIRTQNFSDDEMNYLLPPNGRSTGNAILATDLMCKSTQTIGNQTAGSPALVASPGDQVALRYQENGHVTLPLTVGGKPSGSGVVYVYGTNQPSNSDTYLAIHHVWNMEGTGGDGRGTLLATRNFDDGQCYQQNSGSISTARQAEFKHASVAPMGPNIWCQTNVALPTNAKGNYTLYWVWEWPTLDVTGEVTKNESYTTCMDIVMTPATSTSSKSEAVNFIKGQDLNYAAISAQLANSFLVKPNYTSPVYAPASTAPSSSPTQASATSQSSSQAAAGFITVTVTATPEKETVTVTSTVNGGAKPTSTAQPQSSTVTVSPLPANSTSTRTMTSISTTKSSTPSISLTSTSGPPIIQPFLSPQTTVISQAPPSKPSYMPSTRTPSSTPSYVPAPTQTGPIYVNGSLHQREWKLRGRLVRD